MADEMDEVIIEGTPRKFGNVVSPTPRSYSFAAFDDARLIPQDQWQPIDLGVHLPPVYDQGNIGACNAYAACEVLEACRAMAGLPYVRLSPGYLYGSINGQLDRGSMLEDSMAFAINHGIPTEATVPERDWQRGKWQNAAKIDMEKRRYRMLECWRCPTVGHMASALQCGFFGVGGLMWRDRYIPDADGWYPEPERGGKMVGGHAICLYGLTQRNGEWGFRQRGSWGAGRHANAVLPLACFGSEIGGMWACRAVVTAD